MSHAQVDAPKRPKPAMSAYQWFCKEGPKLETGLDLDGINEHWINLDKATRAKYIEMADIDKARFEKDETAFKKGGYDNTDFDPDDNGEEEFDDADEDVNEVDNNDE